MGRGGGWSSGRHIREDHQELRLSLRTPPKSPFSCSLQQTSKKTKDKIQKRQSHLLPNSGNSIKQGLALREEGDPGERGKRV